MGKDICSQVDAGASHYFIMVADSMNMSVLTIISRANGHGGTAENAVLSQIWIALCVYLVLACLAFLSKIGASMQQILRLLQLNLFERSDLETLFKPLKIEASPQLAPL